MSDANGPGNTLFVRERFARQASGRPGDGSRPIRSKA